ncbi:MAG: diadenylate cyclase [Cryomorphaceae bacterium]|jgi:diadenylate cyclase
MEFIEDNWRAGIEILILWVGLYQLYRVFRATKGALIFVGVVMILAVVTSLAFIFDLKVIAWILLRSAVGIGFALVIVFQLEMRQALARLGGSFFSFTNVQKLEFAEGLTDAVMQLSHKRIGALIALEREISMKEYSENGVRVDAEFSPELTMTIFHPMTALHDGGVIVSKNRIASAGCVFPLSRNEMSDRTLGLRHRAAVGLSEETDSVCIVVSEETGSISIAMNGVLERNLKESEFKEKLEKIFVPEEEEKIDNEEDTREELDSEDSGLDPSGSDLVSDK